MKKQSLLISIILLTVATTIIVASCGKDKDSENNNAKSGLSKSILQDIELSDMDISMIAFGEKMKSAANGKDAVTMPLDEGLTTLTNYQNFTLCNACFNPDGMIVDTFKVKLSVTNGTVSLSDLYGIYESTRTEILARFNVLTGTPKTIFYITTNLAGNTQSGNLNNFSGVVDIDVVSHMANSALVTDPGSAFNASDYWYDFDSLGKCDDYIGLCVGRDCVTELDSKLHLWWSMPHCLDGYRTYFTNYEYDELRAINYPDTSSPNGRYAWPWRSFWDNEICVSPSEMSYYLDTIEAVVSTLEIGTSKKIIFLELNEQKRVNWKSPNESWEADLTYTLATMNCTPLNPGI